MSSKKNPTTSAGLMDADESESCLETEPSIDSVAKLNDLSNDLLRMYKRSRTNLEMLNLAVEAIQTVVQRTPECHPFRAGRLNNLSNALITRFEDAGTIEDLDSAVEASLKAAELTPEGDLNRSGRLHNLSFVMRQRYWSTDNVEDLNEAIRANFDAVSCCQNPSLLSPYLSNLSDILNTRFEKLGNSEDLTQAIDAAEKAVCAASLGDPNTAVYQNNLANVLLNRYNLIEPRDSRDLDRAIDARLEALKIVPMRHAIRNNIQNGLAMSLRSRAALRGSVDDLNKAVELYEDAINQASETDEDRILYHNNLGIALEARFERTGSFRDLNRAVQIVQEGLKLGHTKPADRATCLDTLSLLYRTRFEHTVVPVDEDLRRAVEAIEMSLQQTSKTSTSRGRRLKSLGDVLISRFVELRILEDLNKAISYYEEALSLMPIDSQLYKLCLNNLSTALQHLFDETDSIECLARALKTSEVVLNITPEHDSDRSKHLYNLAKAFKARYLSQGLDDDLERAISLIKESIACSSFDSRRQPRCISFLGDVLLLRYEETKLQIDLEQAIAAYEDTLNLSTASPTFRITIGINAVYLLESLDREHEAANLLMQCIDLLHLTISWSPNLRKELSVLSSFSGLASMAATLGLICDIKPGEAARMLDSARGIILGRLLDLRSVPKGLSEDIVERYINLRSILDPLHEINDDRDKFVDMTHWAALDFEALLAEIRTHDGFNDFGRPITVTDLLTQAQHAPIVILNINPRRSDALIVTDSEIVCHDYSGLSYEMVREQVQIFRTTLEELIRPLHKSLENPEVRKKRVTACEAKISAILEWLWDAIVEQIFQKLGWTTQPPEGSPMPKVVWCPTGLLTFLPIHAAGYHSDSSGRTVIDRVISSYTSTIRALKHSRIQNDGDRMAQNILVAAVSQKALRLAEIEAVIVQKSVERWPNVQHIQVAKRITKKEFYDGLPDKSIVHLVCHATSDADPSSSRVLLEDGDLTIAEISRFNYRNNSLVYLSACSTAFSEAVLLQDECLTLSSAFQAAGFSRVIGTLWDAEDRISLATASMFYDSLGGDLYKSSVALHCAIRKMRDAHRKSPSLWAPYIYVGT